MGEATQWTSVPTMQSGAAICASDPGDRSELEERVAEGVGLFERRQIADVGEHDQACARKVSASGADAITPGLRSSSPTSTRTGTDNSSSRLVTRSRVTTARSATSIWATGETVIASSGEQHIGGPSSLRDRLCRPPIDDV